MDGWTLNDLTVIQHDFFPIYVELVDRMINVEKKEKEDARNILTEHTLAFLDTILNGTEEKKNDEWVLQFSDWQHDYTPAMCDLVENFVNDDDLIAENPTRTKAQRKQRVRDILRFHFPIMIQNLIFSQ